MDFKITKKRLYAFLQYEWIKIIGVMIAGIFILVITFNTFSSEMRKLNAGQRYYFNFSYGLEDSCVSEMKKLVNDSLSYEIQYKNVYAFATDGYSDEQFSAYQSSGELDAMIFNDSVIAEEYPSWSRFTHCVDRYSVWDYDALYESALEYAKSFLTDIDGELTESNLSNEKVEKSFEKIAKTDKRYGKTLSKEEGLVGERKRILNLFNGVNDLKRLLDEHPEIFKNYVKFTASFERGEVSKAKVESEQAKKYGIYLYKLTPSEGKENASTFGRLSNKDNAENVVFAIFNMKREQADMEYESLTVLSNLVRKTTDFLD